MPPGLRQPEFFFGWRRRAKKKTRIILHGGNLPQILFYFVLPKGTVSNRLVKKSGSVGTDQSPLLTNCFTNPKYWKTSAFSPNTSAFAPIFVKTSAFFRKNIRVTRKNILDNWPKKLL
jgi:hypothetical protein